MPDLIAEKYADKVTPEYRAAMQAVGIASMMLDEHRPQYEALLKSKRDMDNFGFVIDPTLYRDALQSKGLAQQIRLVDAVLEFLNVVAEIKREIETC